MRSFTVGFCCSLITVFWASKNVATAAAIVPWFGLLIWPIFTKGYKRLLLGFCVGGVLAHGIFYLELSHQLEPNNGKVDLSIVGTVVSVPKHDSKYTSFMLRIDSMDQSQEGKWPERIRLSWYGPERRSLIAGDQWRLMVRLKPSTSLGNPGGFNYERWLFNNRIHATGYVRDEPPAQRLKQNPFNLHAVRERLAKAIVSLPSANEFAPLVQGLTVGVTSGISNDQWQSLRLSGTAHLLAISGLHIGLISGWVLFSAGFVWQLLQRSFTRSGKHKLPNRPLFALVLSCLGATIYAALAGFSLPTQRALIMLSVFGLSALLRRHWPPGSALLFALLLVLLVEPLSVLSVGFWLSFGTVTALFYLHNGRLSKLGTKSGALALHLKLGVVLLPATAWFFQQGSLIAPVANAIAVPVVGLFVVPASFAIALLTKLWPACANVILNANQWVLEKLLSFLDFMLEVPASSVPLFLPGPLVLLCTLLSLVLLFSPRALRLRWFSIPLIAPAIVLNLIGKPVKGLELHVLDVGQGLSSIVLTDNHTLLFDTGKRLSDEATMFDRVVRPYLISQGRAKIDISILSHADDDHAGGLDSLLAYHPKTQLYASDTEHVNDAGAIACRAGDTFVLDDVKFTFLHPSKADVGSRNNLSCVLLVQYGGTRILLTGDIESEAEQSLVDRMEIDMSVDVLIAPHHGSRSSSIPAFVARVPTDIVIYAAGKNNKFGFPHKEVVQRYEEIGAKAFTTGKHGALILRFDENGPSAEVETFWKNKRRYSR